MFYCDLYIEQCSENPQYFPHISTHLLMTYDVCLSIVGYVCCVDLLEAIDYS